MDNLDFSQLKELFEKFFEKIFEFIVGKIK